MRGTAGQYRRSLWGTQVSPRRSPHLSSVVLNAEAQLHSFGPPEVFASEIIFKLICVDFHVRKLQYELFALSNKDMLLEPHGTQNNSCRTILTLSP